MRNIKEDTKTDRTKERQEEQTNNIKTHTHIKKQTKTYIKKPQNTNRHKYRKKAINK